MSLKNPVIPPGIDPGTVPLVAQRLNHYTTAGPIVKTGLHIYTTSQVITVSMLTMTVV